MPHSKYSGQEIGERGSALYQKMRPDVETPENIGKLLSLDAAVAALGLVFVEEIPANLATDAGVYLPFHAATIVWNDREREVGVLATGKRPLLGTALLDGQELVVQFHDNGIVSVDEL